MAAWRAQPGCEATVLSNLILSRDDQIGCPAFTPIDALEARHPAGTYGPPSTLRPAKPDRQGPLQRSQYMAASQQLPTGRPDSRPGRQPARNPLLHLTACLAITAIAALAILAIHVLT